MQPAALHSRRGLALALAVLSVVYGCSSNRNVEPVSVTPKSRDQAQYVSGIAAAYYCTCEHWPGSWNEIRRFDDYLHARSEAAGEPPLKRFAWADINATVYRHTDGSLIVTPKNDGRLEEKNGEAAKASDDEFDPIAVPVPDCSRFDRSRFVSGCERAAARTR
jgi:hypothetical protein